MSARKKLSATDYYWNEGFQLFAHKRNHRVISPATAQRLGLKPPEKPAAASESKSQPAPEIPQSTAQPAPAQPQQVSQPAPQPQPTIPAQSAAPLPQPETSPQPIEVAESELFSAAQPQPSQEIPPGTQPENKPPPEAPPQDAPLGNAAPPTAAALAMNRQLATMVWGMLLRIFILIFGDGTDDKGNPNPRTAACLPKKFETPAGTIDENENVIQAFCDYFNSIGFVKLTPLWNLILTVAGYFLVRVELILIWFKTRKERSAKSPVQRPEPRQKTEPSEPKSPEQSQPPAQSKSQQQPPAPSAESQTDAEPTFASEE